jgi:hypothetical protein
MFTRTRPERERALLPALVDLTEHHRRACPAYRRVLDATLAPDPGRWDDIAALPWLPVGLFKTHDLKSIPDDEVFRVLTSSGTTGRHSRIALDRAAAAAQQKALIATLLAVVGPQRLPMLIVDSRSTITTRGALSARGAGVLGVMPCGRHHTFVLDDTGRVDENVVRRFLHTYGAQPFLVFGFTFMVWLYLRPLAERERFDLSNATLIHSGGWKKLAERAVDNAHLRRTFNDLGLRQIHNFYGMVEQMGTIFVEGSRAQGLYCPDFADVVVRDPLTTAELPVGKPGLIEVVSTLPRSYPGHVLLTEDLGVVHGIDDGDLPGKRFSVLGRLPGAIARGCGDTFAAAA